MLSGICWLHRDVVIVRLINSLCCMSSHLLVFSWCLLLSSQNFDTVRTSSRELSVILLSKPIESLPNRIMLWIQVLN